jgi:hypothetical protein
LLDETALDLLQQFTIDKFYPPLVFFSSIIQKLFFQLDDIEIAAYAVKALYDMTRRSFYYNRHIVTLQWHDRASTETSISVFEHILDRLLENISKESSVQVSQ